MKINCKPVRNKLKKKQNDMKNNDMKNKTTEQLQSNIIINKAIAIALVIVLTLLTAISIYGLIAKEDTSTFIALLAVVCTSWGFLPIPFMSIKKIKSELKLRENTI